VGTGGVEYRLYFLDRNGHICRGEDFVSENDETAMTYAREQSAGQPAEVWQYARVIGKIPGFRNASAGA
jgi:hypothetical protein